ncbi:copper resistance protein CopC [Arthrobacter sp. N199823]|uniref:copper resistance protein CopC n=1 Tax=Arthrobacter sp. N199823 TaxID=2058895 RepID=UPI000CE3A76C|nr:copper resistance protein CopC [Arthrobacter sp. N199823]
MTRTSPRISGRHPRVQGIIARRFLELIFAALAIGLMLPATPAVAHASLLHSTPTDGAVLPQAPGVVELVFGEPVALAPDGFQLYDDTGGHRTMPAEQLDATVSVSLPSDLPEGGYTLGWRVVSDDSHPVSGMLSFTVGLSRASVPTIVQNDTASVDALYVVLNALGYLGLFCLVGLTAFDLFVVRIPTADRGLSKVAALVAVSAYLVLVPLTAAHERGAGLRALFDPGVAVTGWAGGAALTFVLAFSGAVLMVIRGRLPRQTGFWVGTVGAVIALASVLPVGHTRTFGSAWLMMGADLTHAATAAVWLGGLLALILHVTRARRRNGDPAETAAALGRFSTLAGGVVFLLGITGTVMAVVMVGSVTVLLGSSYGQLLLVKLAMVAAIGGLAAWNRFGLVPRLAREGIKGTAWSRLALAIRLEAVGLVIVIGLTSVLTLQNPRVSEAPAAGGTPVLVELGTGHLTGRFGPGTVGTNVITFELTDAGGTPIVPISMPQVCAAEPNLSLGPLAAKIEPGGKPGSYRSEMTLPVAGQWKITVAVRVNELEQPAAVVEVVVVVG